jgi:uncharacterized protein (TIGR00369 family)
MNDTTTDDTDAAKWDGDIHALANAMLRQQPFTRLLGAQLTTIGDGQAEMHIDRRSELCEHDDTFHGGVIAYLADNACGAAASSVRPKGAIGAVTAEYKINMLTPPNGQRALARATVARAGRTMSVVEARVFCTDDGEEKLVAVALATISYMYP